MAERGNPTGAPYSGTNEDSSSNDTSKEQSKKGRGGEQYKNMETKVNSREYFGYKYETGQED